MGLRLGLKNRFERRAKGTVTAVSSNSFSFKTEDGKVFTVGTTNAKITSQFKGIIALADVHVNDKVGVSEITAGSQITAKTVVVTPANTHPASGRGVVSAVTGSGFTLKTNNQGIVSFVIVNTQSTRAVIKQQNGAITTSASILVGSKVMVKGLWDEVLNIFNAIKINIR